MPPMAKLQFVRQRGDRTRMAAPSHSRPGCSRTIESEALALEVALPGGVRSHRSCATASASRKPESPRRDDPALDLARPSRDRFARRDQVAGRDVLHPAVCPSPDLPFEAGLPT